MQLHLLGYELQELSILFRDSVDCGQEIRQIPQLPLAARGKVIVWARHSTAAGGRQPTSHSQLCKEACLARSSAGVSWHPLPEWVQDHMPLKGNFLNKYINKDTDSPLLFDNLVTYLAPCR